VTLGILSLRMISNIFLSEIFTICAIIFDSISVIFAFLGFLFGFLSFKVKKLNF
jgi:hypothetical protein